MNRYILFAGYNYYPSGGMNDCIGHYATMAELVQNIGRNEWFNILDTKTGEVTDHFEIKGNLTDWAKNHDENDG